MRRTLLAALLLATVAAAGRDPAYDAVLEAYSGKRWKELDRIAPAFLEQHGDHRYAHSVRFMIADSLYVRRRYERAVAACRDYLEHGGKYAERCRLRLVRSLNALWRYEEALDAAGDGLAYERGVALEGLRRFDEALVAYAAARKREPAEFRAAVVEFRARRFDRARRALDAFLAERPDSRFAAAARDYRSRIDPGFRDIRDGVVFDYAGKYARDARFHARRETIPALRGKALAAIAKSVGIEVPDTFLVRFQDSGQDRSGRWATVRTEVVGGKARSVLVLRTEALVLGSHDLEKTMVHELYHCVQREKLGEAVHLRMPKWVREGSALWVAGQLAERAAILAAYAGHRDDPLARLVDGLGGRHTLEDYVEDVCAFAGAERRHGRTKAAALVRRLLEIPDVERAVRETLGEEFAVFERGAAAYAREVLRPLVETGRAEYLAVRAARARKEAGAVVAATRPGGVYTAAGLYYRAEALHTLGRHAEALALLRGEFLPHHRARSTRLDDALFLELRLLRALGSDEFEAAAARARLDLEPYPVHDRLIEFLER